MPRVTQWTSLPDLGGAFHRVMREVALDAGTLATHLQALCVAVSSGISEASRARVSENAQLHVPGFFACSAGFAVLGTDNQ
jgi:hypothetical protein